MPRVTAFGGRAGAENNDPAGRGNGDQCVAEARADALALWRGHALAQVGFEEFAQAEIRQLDELRVAAIELRINAELALGRHARVVGQLEGLCAEHPTRERFAGLLMLALYRCGRQADALEVFQRTRMHLDQELGLEPSEDLKALQAQILEHARSLDLSAAGSFVGGRRQAGLPSGTVTLMFTDVDGSTQWLQTLGDERYAQELRSHRERVGEVVAAHGGVQLGTEGDGCFIAFARASDALEAARALQDAPAEPRLPVRIGIHTGEPLLLDGEYVGLDVHRAARICDAAHAGQVLVSLATREVVGDGLVELGEFRLRDLTAPERLFQLGPRAFPPLRTLRVTNLPVQPGPLFGRQDELADLRTLAAANRLVTLTGPGGSGKTRLSLALAGELSDDYRDGAWWVPLAAVSDPDLVPATIAQRLGARGELHDHLAGKHALLLLDNLEQILGCAPLIADLVGGLPELSVIATSRERLAVSCEQVYPVPPLDEAAAQELFVSRARELAPDFHADETVGEICQRLDRLPLALELASTRVTLMSTAQMLDRIERRLDLLSKGRRDAPDRQATMRATIGWSYDLLSEHEQTLFRKLGVFAGSFELEAAQAVCDADLDDLQSLIDKSLLRRDAHGRFFLLELTREYALEQLQRSGEQATVERRHADWFVALARLAEEHLKSANRGIWLARLDADTDNFRAVLAWCSEHDPAAAIELAATLYEPWRQHGRHQELISWLEAALAAPAAVDTRIRAIGLWTLGRVLIFTEQYSRARGPLEQSLAQFRELGDRSGEASVLVSLGQCVRDQESYAPAIEFGEAAVAISREIQDKRSLEWSLNVLGGTLLKVGELERSEAALKESVAICTELGDKHEARYSLGSLGDVALARGDPETAARYHRKELELLSGLGDERGEMYAVAGLACVAVLEREAFSAGRLWAVVEATETRLGMRLQFAERALYEQIVAPLQNDQAFQDGYEAGREIDLADAVSELREPHGSD